MPFGEVPRAFMDSDNEEDITKLNKSSPPGPSYEPMMVNSATSTGAISSFVPTKYAGMSTKGPSLPNPEAKAFTPKHAVRQDEISESSRISKQYADIMAVLNTLLSKQNTISNMIIELRAEFEVLKKSSARFQTPAPVSGVRTVRKAFRP